ncbi:RNA polymerase sigma-70 factor [Tenacibaculum sp. IB213877]|uniref:RNA polymerase sigma-70 factor n=1 Tax=Tenacibaculum sp. IB213877 TaxID=3097351 RepID=UPI002A59ABCC|nr:RNA polymerase sigma-70 factor [Tenacibaculum sp. IB213877]MDY0779976.1 RNA polymerase sigma-70 factor [Tenacibaculum sp. IB213877]
MNNPAFTLKEFKQIFEALYPSLCLFANTYVKDIAVAKDLVQDVFIKIWESNINLKEKNLTKAYLYTSVKNKCIDYLKSKRVRVINKQVEVEGLDILESETHFNREIILIEASQIIHDAINSLPQKYSQVVLLSMKNLTNKEIAEVLSLNINTVKAHKKIAYQKLRPLLKGYYYLFILIFTEM